MGYTQDSYLSVCNSTKKYRLSKKRQLLLEQNAIRREELAEHGVPLRGRRPKVIEPEEIDNCTCILCRNNLPSSRADYDLGEGYTCPRRRLQKCQE